MNESIYWLFALSIQPRQMEEFRALMKAMIESARGEVDTQSFDWTLSEDSKTCHIFVRHSDCAAAMIHLRTFQAKFAAKLMDLAKPLSLVVYGKPTPQLRDALAAFSPSFMSPLG